MLLAILWFPQEITDIASDETHSGPTMFARRRGVGKRSSLY